MNSMKKTSHRRNRKVGRWDANRDIQRHQRCDEIRQRVFAYNIFNEL